jgi:hypothetical protein
MTAFYAPGAKQHSIIKVAIFAFSLGLRGMVEPFDEAAQSLPMSFSWPQN